ncbi:peptidase m15b and m15c dd-carboxypeptidase vany/endolysin [Paenibacillus sp. FSL R7-269]|uniref:M15 family metallopeptidase n=1 Tax=Paenibacillus sp. FSL R7-269 TaxID=1226755 RepID=UPI0003E1CA22|nr:M15 family metallopeptidase [Paenibacillus sp. FSL R7-269]ETT55410.1 peptidase m15b and m15c dd-carboxypeptidase vany/endolysin [Paenibacillus sp. FSL R7-269]
MDIVINQGLRTIVEQDALYAQGRTKPGQIVTNAKGGTSYHNYGLAVDFALLLNDGKQVSWDMKLDVDKDGVTEWMEVVQEAKTLGFEWGGDWTTFKDYPQLQMFFGLKIADLRTGRKPTGVQMDAAYARIDKLQGEVQEDMSKNGTGESRGGTGWAHGSLGEASEHFRQGNICQRLREGRARQLRTQESSLHRLISQSLN